MRMDKKVTSKDDGRLLIYYHFPGSASAEETETFAAIQAMDPSVETGQAGSAPSSPSGEDTPRV